MRESTTLTGKPRIDPSQMLDPKPVATVRSGPAALMIRSESSRTASVSTTAIEKWSLGKTSHPPSCGRVAAET